MIGLQELISHSPAVRKRLPPQVEVSEFTLSGEGNFVRRGAAGPVNRYPELLRFGEKFLQNTPGVI